MTGIVGNMPKTAGQDVEAGSGSVANSVGDANPKADWTDKQSGVLPHKKLIVVFPILALVQFTSYLDQTTISTAVPSVGADLQLGASVSWVASSFLIASVCTQLINGRLSDIFGRKELLMSSLALLALGNLCAGFAQNGAMLYAFRALSGLGAGALNALVMIIASDITTLRERGKYNGYLGAAVALGNGVGPLMGGVLTSKIGWRWALWYDVPWVAFIIVLVYFFLPTSKVTGNALAKLKMVDWLGVALSVIAVLLLLIPLSQGGAAFAWDSPIVISMFIIGAFTVAAFIIVEWKVARLPVMPRKYPGAQLDRQPLIVPKVRLFRSDKSANIILIQSVLFGFVFWGNIYYVPLYLQNVLGYHPIISGAAIIPMVATQGIGSIIGGRIISKIGHYNPVIITAQLIWLIGASLQLLYTRNTQIWMIIVVGFLQGLGVGGAFQPSLVALLAHSKKADRAVINSLRNFIRTLGGAVGLTVSGTIMANVLTDRLGNILTDATIDELTASTSGLRSVVLTAEQQDLVLDAYMGGIHTIFITYAPIIGICFLLALFVKDDGLAERDAPSRLNKGGNGDESGVSTQTVEEPNSEVKEVSVEDGNGQDSANARREPHRPDEKRMHDRNENSNDEKA